MSSEIILNGFTLPTSRGPIVTSIRISDEIRIGKPSVVEGMGGEKIDCAGMVLMPTIHDTLSWIDHSRDSDMIRYRESLLKGGVGSGFFESAVGLSRIGWADLGRKILKNFGRRWGLYGPEAYVSRWKSLFIRSEIAEPTPLIHPNSLRERRETPIALCPAQEHHASHISDHSPVVKLWWSKGIEKLQGTLSQEEVDSIHNSEIEDAFVKMANKFHLKIVGSTTGRGTPFLQSLLFDKRNPPPYTIGTPMRKNRRDLIVKVGRNWQGIALGNDPESPDEDVVANGTPTAENAMTKLLGVLLKDISPYGIYSHLMEGHNAIETPIGDVPSNFVLLKRLGKHNWEPAMIYLDELLML